MSYQGPTVSIQVPEPIFRRLQRAAELTYRSVEEVLATTIEANLPFSPDLPSDLAHELAAMNMMSDEALWAASESSLSPAQHRRLRQLTRAGGERTLTPAESAELQSLIDQYDRSVLRRAHALAVLAHRGHDVSQRSDLPQLAENDG
jgi:hypothetical protein